MQHAQMDFSFLMYTHDKRSVQCYCVLMELINWWIVDWSVRVGEGRCIIALKPRVWGQIFLEWMTTKTFFCHGLAVLPHGGNYKYIGVMIGLFLIASRSQ